MIYDCFMYFNEENLLPLRLNILNNYVDYFVIVESTKTHSGKDKPLYFQENKELFKEFLPKIRYIIYDPDKDYSALENEHNQRNKIIDGLYDALCEDIIIISDLDEIPNTEKIQFINETVFKTYPDSVLFAKQWLSYYYLNFRDKQLATPCFNSKFLLYNTLQCKYNNIVQSVRSEQSGMVIDDCGWHFSFTGGKDNIKEKLEAYSHQEFNNEQIINNIESVIETGKDLFNRSEYKFTKQKIDNTFPQYVIEHEQELISQGLIKY